MTKKQYIIGGIVLAAGIGAWFLINRKDRLSNTGPSKKLDTPDSSGSGTYDTMLKKQVYAKSGTIIRSSPNISDGFMGLFGNNVASPSPGIWLGTIKGNPVADTDGAVNPATGRAYNWYEIVMSPDFLATGVASSTGKYYGREDFITIK